MIVEMAAAEERAREETDEMAAAERIRMTRIWPACSSTSEKSRR